MTDIHDLLDEVNCSDSCEAVIALCELIDKLVQQIQHLELECISTRYLLSQYLDEEHGELLRLDIMENLGERFINNPAYELYKQLLYDGGDPMDFRSYRLKRKEASIGKYPSWH